MDTCIIIIPTITHTKIIVHHIPLLHPLIQAILIPLLHIHLLIQILLIPLLHILIQVMTIPLADITNTRILKTNIAQTRIQHGMISQLPLT
ncbi:hypothetical protein BLM37_04310 [Candidatus Gracilibacteria bacterium GN02-873]|nr:hypothetical protein BLM37_04310 [Candidatus Gracilibacteria bacterium GN02-873]